MCGYKIEFESRLIMLYPQYFIDDLKTPLDIGWKLACLGLLIVLAFKGFGQDGPKAIQIDEFGKATNDDLQARVDNFQAQISNGKSRGFVILYGSAWAKYLNQRRIEGCNLMRRYPVDSLKFIFVENQDEVKVEFWKVPNGVESSRFTPTIPDYKLNELTTSMATDDFCPRHFDVDWYAHFMNANPTFSGRVVIDVKGEKAFQGRVHKYQIELERLGVSKKRIRYFHRRLHGERDEQFWLIPVRQR
jgi:hypothetical protein